jgi:hypothetical protein
MDYKWTITECTSLLIALDDYQLKKTGLLVGCCAPGPPYQPSRNRMNWPSLLNGSLIISFLLAYRPCTGFAIKESNERLQYYI